MLESAEVEIKKEHVVFMVKKTTELKKLVKGRRERREARRRMASQLSFILRHLNPSPELSASTARVKVTGNATAPST